MISTGFEQKVKIQQIIESQFPEFVVTESPNAVEFLRQYYISQEYQSGPIDLADNLDQYLKLDNITPEVIIGETVLSQSITSSSSVIQVGTTKGFPNEYGLLKIDDEIITYTGITTNTFTGCIRGFSGISSYKSPSNPGELVFESTEASAHSQNSKVYNLSSLFLKEFYKKIKYTLTPGFENIDLVPQLNVNTFIKESKSFYRSKGTEESFKILFRVLFGIDPKVVDLEQFLIKPSSAGYLRRNILFAERISGDPAKLAGQTLYKSNNLSAQVTISEVEILTRNNKTYYKLYAFIGYDGEESLSQEFSATGKTKVVQSVSSNSSTITVDSTIGFAYSGKISYGLTIISYTSKSLNQFFGCSGIPTLGLNTADTLISTDTAFGYENGDITKKVELRLCSVISKFVPTLNNYLFNENDEIKIKNLGKSLYDSGESDYDKVFSSSWIYNTCNRFFIKSINGSSFTLYNPLEKYDLTIGDRVDIVSRGSTQIIVENALVSSISPDKLVVGLTYSVNAVFATEQEYDIRRKHVFASSSGEPILQGNSTVSANIQNVYLDNENFYVASNSLPSSEITTNVSKVVFDNELDYQIIDSKIICENPIPFLSGDRVYYTHTGTPINGLAEGFYYVYVVDSYKKELRLYYSNLLIGSSNYISISKNSNGVHSFKLYNQKNNYIAPQKLLKKFSRTQNIKNSITPDTTPGTIGMMIDGVEILNYKSNDKVYYGPLDKINVINGGSGYDIISPPIIEIGGPSVGNTAYCQPILRGNIKNVLVDPQNFDIEKVLSISVTGGNGSSAILDAIVDKQYREVSFDARITSAGGGVGVTSEATPTSDEETITFLEDHNFRNGEAIVYNSNGNVPLGVSTFKGSNSIENNNLVNGVVYYSSFVNSKTIKLYPTEEDYIAGINTVGFSTFNTRGIHKFRTFLPKNRLKDIKVVNPGFNYENRLLRVSPSGISTTNNLIEYKNHGFSSGEKVIYSSTGTIASPLVNQNEYIIIKISDDAFRVCSGLDNYIRNDYVKLSSIGSGYHTFKYPEIQVNVLVQHENGVGIITATPIVRGEIVGAYLYVGGSNYGSVNINTHKKPTITVKRGKNAQLKANIIGGKIVDVQILNKGQDYYTIPDLVVEGAGSGAKLRAVINQGKIENIIIIDSGAYYDSNTKITLVEPGIGVKLDPEVRSLTVNYCYNNNGDILQDSDENLKYNRLSYDVDLFNESPNSHSSIIGWAYDGNPIYGPYGYSTAFSTLQLKKLNSGYTLDSSSVTNRPSNYPDGFFVEDYKFVGGDLDEYNGRYCVTPEFKNGVYAYFAAIDSQNQPIFPYFIGNKYRSNLINQAGLNQEFNFVNSDLIRNTHPYGVDNEYEYNEFIQETNKFIAQNSTIKSTSTGSIDNIKIVSRGDNYKVGDLIKFEDISSGSASAYVSYVNGKEVEKIETTAKIYDNSVLIWKPDGIFVRTSTPHLFNDNDRIIVSGVSTYIPKLTKYQKINNKTESTILLKNVSSSAGTTDIYVSSILPSVSAGSSIKLENEVATVLAVYPEKSVMRIQRYSGAVGHTTSSQVTLLNDSFTIPLTTKSFTSYLDSTVYFNPFNSVGFGTTVGISSSLIYSIGESQSNISVPHGSIYIPNHQFNNNEKVALTIPVGGTLVVYEEGKGQYNIPNTLYVTNKSKDFIGIKTTVSGNEVFFASSSLNSNLYKLKTDRTKVYGTVEQLYSTITTIESHQLQKNDVIKLEVNPNTTVGIGTSTKINLSYNSTLDKILANKVYFSNSGVSTSSNSINIPNHQFNSGDKVYYNSDNTVMSGVSTGVYYVYVSSENLIKLCKTYVDSASIPTNEVSLLSQGGSLQHLTLVSPRINVFGKNSLKFDLSDASLANKELKFFLDREYKNEFVSVGSSSSTNILSIGTIGVSNNASVTVLYNENNPPVLYYTLKKSDGSLVRDIDLIDYNEICYEKSFYNGFYDVLSTTTNTFSINLLNYPESFNYNSTNSEITYSTKSLIATGGISDTMFTSKGYNYNKIPKIVSVASTQGSGAELIAESKSIGKIQKVAISDPGYDFASDSTLKPEALLPYVIEYYKSNEVTDITIIDGGKNYAYAPSIVLYDKNTNEVIASNYFTTNISGSSINSVTLNGTLRGLSSTNYEVFAVNNSNGVVIESATLQGNNVTVECKIRTPINGYTTEPFDVNDKIFVEGFPAGSGFNSADNDYQFFTVVSYTNAGTQNDRYLTYEVPSGINYIPVGVTTNTNSYASAINYQKYPKFKVVQNSSLIELGEKLILSKNNEFITTDLEVVEVGSNFVKVLGNYKLSLGDKISTNINGSEFTVKNILINEGYYELGYYVNKNLGWSDNIGFLNDETQVLPDNDYYQNLSYTIKSPIKFNDFIGPVNSLVHPSGTKNFADVGIETSKALSNTAIDSIVVSRYDIIENSRVDTLYNYDFVYDFNVENNKSKYLEFVNRRLTDYIDCKTNKVIIIDDISPNFNGITTHFALTEKGDPITGIRTDNTLIAINGVTQYPLSYSAINYNLTSAVNNSIRYLSVSGISSVYSNSILKIDNEYVQVTSVGVGTTTNGPISETGDYYDTLPSGKYYLFEVDRGFFGSTAASHLINSSVRVYNGNYNIVNSTIYFSSPPAGSSSGEIGETGIKYPNAVFDGRVYQQFSYNNNLIYDDISYKFDGITDTFTITKNGTNVTGITTGNGLVFINGIFQNPTTSNNSDNSYNFIENAGISSIVFSGAVNPETSTKYVSSSDVNRNQLPKGGIIVSFGFTGGLGYAPLVGASVTAVTSGGAIVAVGLGSTDILGSGYNAPAAVAVRDLGGNGAGAVITTNVGLGGTLSFNISNGGSNYVRPILDISAPSYSLLPVTGISRKGVGLTTQTGLGLLLNVEVEASNEVGIGSTLFAVKNIDIARPGYAFKAGDVFRPVGLVTAKGLNSPIEELKLTVLSTYNDNFASWQFGELDYIDSIKSKQNGVRKRFPLYYKEELLSFETDNPEIDLSAVLVIFINGVLQTPNKNYTFKGGTSFNFISAPSSNDIVDIFFYKGTSGVDSILANGSSDVKIGDEVKVKANPDILGTIEQSNRTIYEYSSKSIETNLYYGAGIDSENPKPIDYIKQKVDTTINGELVYKSRDSLEGLIFPTARIIKNFNSADTILYVDNASIFAYDELAPSTQEFDCFITNSVEPVAAGFSAVVSAAGTIQSILVLNGGSGYSGVSTSVKISKPKLIGVGIGTTATATATIVNGSITNVSINNPGFGYTTSILPQVIASKSSGKYSSIKNANVVKSYTGIVTAIEPSTGIGGNAKALKFYLKSATSMTFEVGDVVYITDTTVGSGITSINSSNSDIVGIGTSCVNTVYYVNQVVSTGNNSAIVCNIHSGINTAGLTTSGPVGYFSMGKLVNIQRTDSNSYLVNGYTVNSGLTTYPVLQRRNCGIRSTGSLIKVRQII
jgi:hypothetical protein